MKTQTLLEKALAKRPREHKEIPEGLDDLAIAHIEGRITLSQVTTALGRMSGGVLCYTAIVRGLRAAYQNGKLKITNGKP